MNLVLFLYHDENTIDANIIDENLINENTIDENLIDENLIDENLIDENTIDENTIDENTIDANAVINKKCEMVIINQYNENHFLCNCKIDNIIDFNICKWEYNRPPDYIRVSDIGEFIHKGGPIDWIIYCTYISKIGEISKIEIYDGMHRISAIKDYINIYELTQNTRCTLRDQSILISIRINPTLGETIDAFQNINRCVSIPDLYIDNSSIIEGFNTKKNIIEEIIQDYTNKFKPHFKSSIRAVIPNINRDIFINIIDKIYDFYKIKYKNQLENILNMANLHIQNDISNIKYTENALNKCKKTGCYLFIIKHISIYEYITNNIII